MALVIKSWFADENPKDGVYVQIIGRQAGLLSWLLNLLGIDPTVKFEVRKEHLIHEAGSWSGRLRQVVPMRSVSRTCYGYKKPWIVALIIAIFVGWIVFSIIGAIIAWSMGIGTGSVTLGFLLGLAGGIWAGARAGLWYYDYKQVFSIGFVEISSWSADVAFERSILGGQNIDEKAAEKVASIIRNLVDSQSHA